MNPLFHRPVLLTGGTGRLGRHVARELACRGLNVRIWSGTFQGRAGDNPVDRVDLTRSSELRSEFQKLAPCLVIHAAALSSTEGCRADPEAARRINVDATRELGDCAKSAGVRMLYTSTDLVFDGERGNYSPQDAPCPVLAYGRTKAEAEAVVLASETNAVVRLSLLFGPKLGERDSFFDLQLRTLSKQSDRLKLFTDEWRTPIDFATAANALVDIALSSGGGIWHVGGPERMSRWEMGERLARFLQCDVTAFEATSREAVPGEEPRPRDVSLDSSRWRSEFPVTAWPAYEAALRLLLVSPRN